MSDTKKQQTPSEQVLVTGANRNIGAHLAQRFLDDGFGVIAQYRSDSEAIDRLAQRGAHLVQGEFSTAGEIEKIADRIEAVAPALRAIVHNASEFAPTKASLHAATDQFLAYYQVHMLAPYILNTRLAQRMQAGPEMPADIIHITDIHADNPAPEYDIYCATKAGLQNMTLAFAKRLAPRIKVNAIQPGPISFEPWHNNYSRDQILASTPLGRPGSPEAIYTAIRAIMTNDYQTGAVIPVDGGRRLGRA